MKKFIKNLLVFVPLFSSSSVASCGTNENKSKSSLYISFHWASGDEGNYKWNEEDVSQLNFSIESVNFILPKVKTSQIETTDDLSLFDWEMDFSDNTQKGVKQTNYKNFNVKSIKFSINKKYYDSVKTKEYLKQSFINNIAIYQNWAQKTDNTIKGIDMYQHFSNDSSIFSTNSEGEQTEIVYQNI